MTTAKKKPVKINKFHDLPGFAITTPFIDEFKVEDNNGNWKIERPLFRWSRVHKFQAEDEAKMLNIGYQIAMYDLAAKRPKALKNFAKLKGEMERIEKQMEGVVFK
jgi:hypothetical protein